ncbi:MAG: bifunctional enoyl-CoA hydratase/phosphate acetyltransferase [Hyphomicrobiaceae bacterium]
MTLTNTPWEQLQVGQCAELERLCVADDLFVFAHASGSMNPAHLPSPADANGSGPIAPSMWVASVISAVVGNKLPGPGTLYRAQSLEFVGRVRAGDTLVAKVTVLDKMPDRIVRLETTARLQDGTEIARGYADVIAPEFAQSFDAATVPGLTVRKHAHFDRLLARAEALPPIPTAVVAPEESSALEGALLGAAHTLITPILIGRRDLIEAAAAAIGADISAHELIEAPTHDAAAAIGVDLVTKGRAQALMKGHLHTDALLHHVVKREGGLRTSRRLSHVYIMDVPGLQQFLLVTDAAINIAPDLETKVDIVQNAIDVARAIGITEPKVGILSALETVNPKIPSTIDAAALAKMSERGQITGGIVDGPLALDNAVDVHSASKKGIKSLVAGRADILVVPNLEAGNIVAKQLTFVAHAEAGGIVVGARCPIILTSRSDDERARLASCAVAALYDAWVRTQ